MAAADNLRREGVDRRRIFVTGNTGIDAVLEMRDALARGALATARVAGFRSLQES